LGKGFCDDIHASECMKGRWGLGVLCPPLQVTLKGEDPVTEGINRSQVDQMLQEDFTLGRNDQQGLSSRKGTRELCEAPVLPSQHPGLETEGTRRLG
jgi:hypothetical protein